VIIYQEDIIKIIREYSKWDYEKCNAFRRALSIENITDD
jgi:DNA polymerase III alpha subunit